MPAPLAVIDPFFALAPSAGRALGPSARQDRAPTAKRALAHGSSREIDAALAATLAELDRFGIERAGISLDEDPELARAALASHPARFFARCEADPRRGLAELRRLEALARDFGLRAVTVEPARHFVPIDDKRFYPLFAKCVELDVVVCPSLGVTPERVPFAPQKLERIDPVAWFFPELRITIRGGGLPWQALAVLLLRKYPRLGYTTADLAPSEVPAEILAFASEDGAHQVLFASGGAERERALKELPALPLARAAWPRFLRENALRWFRLA
jgi:hypothetical protein